MDDDLPDASSTPHPDSILRLASAVHRFSIPCVNPEDQLSFADSFKTCSAGHRSTVAAVRAADDRRQDVKKCMADGKLNHASLGEALVEYIPLVNQILLSCKFQPEVARLDKRLLFSWASGVEKSKGPRKRYFESEALMFELVLAVSTLGLSESNLGCDACVEGDFPGASRHFARAAGVFKLLGEDLLPNWMANSKQHAEMERDSLAETRVGVAVAFATLFQATAQQMAVATVLVRPGVPNYALVGKLCHGIGEELDSFVKTLRSKSSIHMAKMDPAFLTLVTFSVNVQRALGLYFLARSLWDGCEYGFAIAAMSEATVAMRTRTSAAGRGLPEVEAGGPLQSLVPEINGFRTHMAGMLRSWEKDNSLVYFDRVPPSLPANKALKSILLRKAEDFSIECRDPLPLGPDQSAEKPVIGTGDGSGHMKAKSVGRGSMPPSYDQAVANDPRVAGRRMSDEELARELQEKLNSE